MLTCVTKTFPPAIPEDILDSLVAEENLKIKEFFPSVRGVEKTESYFLDFGFVCVFQGSMPGEIPKDVRKGDGARERNKEMKMKKKGQGFGT
jgi:hypothetical protein